MRKGKYHNYKLALLEYLFKNDFLVELHDVYMGSLTLASELNIPTSSWYDITKELDKSGLILIKTCKKLVGGTVVDRIDRIQLTKKGLDFLTRFRHA